MDPDDDLPDIIDVVMEMGRKTEGAEKAPSPLLPAEFAANDARICWPICPNQLGGNGRFITP
jgi:hypothetical protein